MRGPDPHGPTLERRLIVVARVVASAAIVIGVIVATVVWTGIQRRAGIPVGARGGARPAPVQPAPRQGAAPRDEAAGRDEVAGRGQAVARGGAARDGAAHDGAARDGATIEQAIAASAFVIVDLSTGRAIREQKGEWLDTPVWPGSIAKLATFAAAIDAGRLTDATRITCPRQLTLPGGRRVDCTHPPLGHPLSPVEALASSCNIFTATLARGLTREQLSSGFVRMGLPPVPAGVDLVTSAFGLGGSQVAPRKLIEAVRRAAEIPLIREGLRASARTGTSSAFAAAGIEALAKTGTAPMRGGRALGLVSAVTPADSPRYGIVVALPGGSGAQAAETAAAILRSHPLTAGSPPARTLSAPAVPPPASAAPSSSATVSRAPQSSMSASHPLTAGSPPARTLNAPAVPSPPASAAPSSSATVSSAPQSSTPASSTLRIGRPTAKGYAVDTLDVEEYVARVVAGETSDAMPAAAREALAITARTFAMVNRGRHAGDGFDLCTLTHCQVTRSATRSSRGAADRTRGQVLVDDRNDRDDRDDRNDRNNRDDRDQRNDRDDRAGRTSRLAPVFYSASCGGMLADVRTVLPNADASTMPWLASRPDPAGIEEVTWETDIPANDLLRALQQSGSRGDTLRNLIAHAGAGGRSGVRAGSGAGTASGADSGGSADAARIRGNADGGRVPTPSTPANLGRRRAPESGGASSAAASNAAASNPADSNAAPAANSDRGSSASPDSSDRRGFGAGPGPGTVTHVTTEGLMPSTLAIDDFRRAVGQQLGWHLLKSTRFTVQRTSRGYRFTGRGHGHGVGLCVLGASALAARGADATRILEAYFPGLQAATAGTRNVSAPPPTPRLERPSTGASTPRPAIDGTPRPAIDSTPLPAIELRLPSSDESERPRLTRLIATNLKELALDLSLPSPSGLDVVVHPTVNAYRRATRSPSWTSAATILSGDDITLHFAPLSVLDRGAMLTQTVRHELVHVLTIRALFDRPRWVHEGLALHLAGERVSAEPDEASADAVKCPSDRDLMRPRSRAAFDRAYSRAAACVARELAAGRNWRDLGAR
jgi:Stage II sporulation protein/Penicillin binding protein transpeptidase domain